jgi:hypothetical protein
LLLSGKVLELASSIVKLIHGMMAQSNGRELFALSGRGLRGTSAAYA